MKILLVLFVLWFSTAQAETREWTDNEKVWGVIDGALLLSDWATTHNMTHRYNEGYYERNPLLGAHPTTAQVNLHFFVVIPLIYLAADQVPEYRTEILQAVSAVELIAVGNNLRLGLHFQF
jgi:hypothetical protein